MRPKSVILAERLYGLAILLSLLLLAVSLVQAGGAIGPRLIGLAGTALVVSGLSLLLLVLAARRASRIALWLLTILTALNVAGFLLMIAQGAVPARLQGVVTTVQVVLTVVAIVMLFRPNARVWFAEQRVDEDEDEELSA
jgi:hypothetical protein